MKAFIQFQGQGRIKQGERKDREEERMEREENGGEERTRLKEGGREIFRQEKE